MPHPSDETLAATVTLWLAQFEQALTGSHDAGLAALFTPDAHWRDLLALTWEVKTRSGSSQVTDLLRRHGQSATGFVIDPQRIRPRQVTRAGSQAIEAFFRFETPLLRCQGVLRLKLDPVDSSCKAWTLLTAIDEIKGSEPSVGSRRPHGTADARDFSGPNWLDRRRASTAYADRDPEVLVVGGGHAGLSIAAHLRQLGVDTLIVDREERIGDNWRKRYHALTLHNQVHVNHLPYLPFPASWPTYIPKDKLAGWFEAYVEIMELDFWTRTEFCGANHDAQTGRWTATLRLADGSSRTMHPRHVVMATGMSDVAKLPDIASLKAFQGQVIHSHQYGDAAPWKGRDVMVIGTGTSGHDISQDLQSNGARVTLVQRSPTLVLNVEPSAQLPYVLYGEGHPVEDCDLISASMPLALMKTAHRAMALQAKELDQPLLADLARVGFKTDEADELGWQFKYLQRGGGYYFNVGCSNLIAQQKIRLVQYADIEGFVVDGATLRSGEAVAADLVVLATGYQGLGFLVRRLFGDAVADRVGPIWGFDEEAQELRNMWMRTKQPGLWFIAGSFAQCRIYAKYLALQIKAAQLGLLPPAPELSNGNPD
jgi:cation diffusion facilitator CzcD-associated flavoprotein CzcO